MPDEERGIGIDSIEAARPSRQSKVEHKLIYLHVLSNSHIVPDNSGKYSTHCCARVSIVMNPRR
jgi:hypothetical protein